ncbi:hypothetical protein N825_31600 [Skermanella stibiiresistens SB22]|uniref:Uncharacterized protein n=1 Tax=Skermanella stibiiresistens SB22 TaxID=1385369 RepID=W9H5E5_9PROT|nr:hypothetical protein [Skermanella stibiiresistens]EWY41254.1 hypothetical protein N825_31600 [Skermanella stibiiresistens SB22]
MSTIERAEIHRMATKIALSYARSHNETFEAFPSLFKTAYHGLLSCSHPAAEPVKPPRHPAPPSKPTAKPISSSTLKPAAPPKPVVQAKPAPTPRSPAVRAKTAPSRGRPTWTAANALGKPKSDTER